MLHGLPVVDRDCAAELQRQGIEEDVPPLPEPARDGLPGLVLHRPKRRISAGGLKGARSYAAMDLGARSALASGRGGGRFRVFSFRVQTTEVRR